MRILPLALLLLLCCVAMTTVAVTTPVYDVMGALQIELVDLARIGRDGKPVTLGVFQPLGLVAAHPEGTAAVVSAGIRLVNDAATVELSPVDPRANTLNGDGIVWVDTLEFVLMNLDLTAATTCNRASADCSASIAIRATLHSVAVHASIAGTPAARSNVPNVTLEMSLTRRFRRSTTDDQVPQGDVTMLQVDVAMGMTVDRNGQIQRLRTTNRPNLVTSSNGIVMCDHNIWFRDSLELNHSSAKDVSIRLSVESQSDQTIERYDNLHNSFHDTIRGKNLTLNELEELKKLGSIVAPHWRWLVLSLVFTIIFNFLAVKNDVQFWRAKTRKGGDMRGLSLRAVAISCIARAGDIALLFSEPRHGIAPTNLLLCIAIRPQHRQWLMTILFVFECWKFSKCIRFARRGAAGQRRLVWNTAKSGDEDDVDVTSQHDAEAVRWLGCTVVPMLVEHFGFGVLFHGQTWGSSLKRAAAYLDSIALLPQIYINYKMKSAAGMPCKAINYWIAHALACLPVMIVLTGVSFSTLLGDALLVALAVQQYVYR